MNRREFLKGGIGGVLAMLLGWAGVAREVESQVTTRKPENDLERFLDWVDLKNNGPRPEGYWYARPIRWIKEDEALWAEMERAKEPKPETLYVHFTEEEEVCQCQVCQWWNVMPTEWHGTVNFEWGIGERGPNGEPVKQPTGLIKGTYQDSNGDWYSY